MGDGGGRVVDGRTVVFCLHAGSGGHSNSAMEQTQITSRQYGSKRVIASEPPTGWKTHIVIEDVCACLCVCDRESRVDGYKYILG